MSPHHPRFSGNAAVLGTVLLAVALLAACSGSSADTAGSASSTPPITIGVSLSLHGGLSADGIAFERGYELWVRDVNAAGGILGRQAKLTILDDDSNTNQAIANYQTLINIDHVDLTFGPISSTITSPASEVAALNGYAFIDGTGASPETYDTPSNEADHNIFDVSLPIAEEFEPFVNYIASLPASTRDSLTAAYPSAAYPAPQDPGTTPAVQLAQQELQVLGVKTVYSTVFPEETAAEYSASANAVAAKAPDIVILGSTSVSTVAAFMQQFEAQLYTPKYFIAEAGPDQGQTFISAVGRANAPGMMVPYGWNPSFANAASQKMVNEYVREYGGRASAINPDIAEAYSVGQVAEEAIKATGGVDNATIIKYLHSGVTLTTVQGSVRFDSLGENTAADAFVFQWNKTGTLFRQVLPADAPGSVALLAPKPAWGQRTQPKD